MSNRLGGSARGSSYLGTNAVQPPDCVFSADTAPTQYDINHSLLDLWLNQQTQIVYVLVSLAGTSTSAGPLATWIPLNGGGGGNISTIIPDSGIDVVPNAMGDVNILGGANINTVGTLNTLTVNLNNSVFLPETTVDTLSGVLGIGSSIAVQMFGSGNIFLGDAGNFTLTGSNNTATGFNSGVLLTSADNNVIYGAASGQQLLSGDNNLLLGFGAGSDYTGAESNNILLQNVGVVGESNTMRLGLSGSGTRQVNNVFMGGVFASSNTLNANNGIMIVDTNDVVKMSRGTNGQLPIGSTGTGPVFANLTSMGGTVTITNGPGSINLESTGGGTAVNCAFLAQNTPNVPNVTGNGTVYTYGSTQDLVEIFDVGNNFNPATGIFTAPTNSQYYLEITVDLTNVDSDSGNNVGTCTAQIVTTARTYIWNFSGTGTFGADSGGTSGVLSFQQIVDMDAGDTAAFTIATNQIGGGGNQVIGLGANAFVAGYLVSGAGVGILEVDADAGSAVPAAGVLQILGGTNCSTVGAGNTITINATGGGGGFVTWSVITASQIGVAGEGYFCNGGAPVVITLPAVAAVGDTIAVAAMNANGFQVAQTAGVSIRFTNALTTVGVGGSLASTAIGDAVVLVCNVANTGWFAVPGSMGNITIV